MTEKVGDLHRRVIDGFAQGAGSYVKGRPDYPPELDGWLRETLGLGDGKSVVDLGAGTGKFTPRLVATGARVLAVEPVAQMREQLRRVLPEIEVLDGTAQHLPFADACVDAIVCAQSFHWFATHEALTEIHRVLKPGGWLGLVWNLRDNRTGWVARLDALIERDAGDAPRVHTGEWRRAFPFDGFTMPVERRMPHSHTGSLETVIVERVRSSSVIAALDAASRAQVEREVQAIIESEPELAGQASVTMPYQTFAFSAQRVTYDSSSS